MYWNISWENTPFFTFNYNYRLVYMIFDIWALVLSALRMSMRVKLNYIYFGRIVGGTDVKSNAWITLCLKRYCYEYIQFENHIFFSKLINNYKLKKEVFKIILWKKVYFQCKIWKISFVSYLDYSSRHYHWKKISKKWDFEVVTLLDITMTLV